MVIDKIVDEKTPEERFNDAVTIRALREPVNVLAYADVVSHEKGEGMAIDRRYVFGDKVLVIGGCHYEKSDLPGIVDDMTSDLNHILDGSFEAKYGGREGEVYRFRVWTTLEFRKGLAEFESKGREKR